MFPHLDETQQCVPRLDGKRAFSEDVGQLVLRIHVFYTNHRVLDEALEEPAEVNSVSPTYVPHEDAPTFNRHFNDGFVVLQDN